MFVFPGFNSNIEHREKKYHIQTEVNAVQGKSKINTLVYLSGRIYLSFSSEMNEEDSLTRETALSAIRKQHNKIIRDLISDQLEADTEQNVSEGIDFAAMYKDKNIFYCCSDDADNTRELLKSLIIVPDDGI